MAEWTPEATEYLDGYLKQVRALARGAGEDGDDIASGLREHIIEKTEREAGPLVTLEVLRRALAEVGAPEAIVDDPASWQKLAKSEVRVSTQVYTPPPSAPPIVPPVAPPPRDRSGRFLRWTLGCLVLAILGMVLTPILLMILGITLPAMSRAREAARRAECQNHLKQIGMAIERWEEDHPGEKTYPTKMSEFYPKYIQNIEVFACPSSPERNRKPEELDEWCAYTFNTNWSGDVNEPLIVEKTTSNHVPGGRHVAYNNGRVEFQKADAADAHLRAVTHAEADETDTEDPVSVARAFLAAVAENDIDKALQLTAEDQRSSLRNEWGTIRSTIPPDPKLEVTRLVENGDADISVTGTDVVLHAVVRDGKWRMAR